jgi:hypothetical protein
LSACRLTEGPSGFEVQAMAGSPGQEIDGGRFVIPPTRARPIDVSTIRC